jgi:sugar phosphate isomerase/epimerase
MVQLAADTGCAAAGVRLLPTSSGGPAYRLMDDPALLRETLAVQRGTGVRILDLEVVRLNARFELAHYLAFLGVGQQLGAAHVLVAGDDPDEARLTASYAAFCEAAARHGMTADLEFMPWTEVPHLGAAQRIVSAADQPNAAVLVDALHFGRSASRLGDLAGWPRSRLNYAQICDGKVPMPLTHEGLIFDARCERLLPGEGGIDLVSLFACLPADITISIEVPSDSRAPAMGYTAWAQQAIAATDRVLGQAAMLRAQLPPAEQDDRATMPQASD